MQIEQRKVTNAPSAVSSVEWTHMSILAHIATVAALLGAFLVAPVLATVDVAALLASGPDLVSSATVIADAPSGSYVILINADRHPDAETLSRWIDFFQGRDVSLIMEDVSCVALEGDTAGIEMAESLQSRLAEHQMSLRTEQAALALSKAESGAFDVLVMSAEAADAYEASTAYDLPNVVVVRR